MVWQSFTIEEILEDFPRLVARLEELEARYLLGTGGFLARLLAGPKTTYQRFRQENDRYLVRPLLTGFAEAASHLTQVLIGYNCHQEAQEVANYACEAAQWSRDRERLEEAWLLFVKAHAAAIDDQDFHLDEIRSGLNRLLHQSGGEAGTMTPHARRIQAHLMQQTAQILWRIFHLRERTLRERGDAEALRAFLTDNLVAAWNMKLLNPELRSQGAFRRRVAEELPEAVTEHMAQGLLFRSLYDWLSVGDAWRVVRDRSVPLKDKLAALAPVAAGQRSVVCRRYERVFRVKIPYRKGLRLPTATAEKVSTGRKLFLDGDVAGALRVFEDLFQEHPMQPFLKEWYALMRGETGDIAAADRLLSQVINVRQANFITFWNLAYYKFRQDLKRECLELLSMDHWMKLNLNRDEYSTVLLGLAIELGQTELALDVLESPTMLSYLPLAVDLAMACDHPDRARRFDEAMVRELQQDTGFDNDKVPLEDERRVPVDRLKAAFSFFVSHGLEDAGIRYFKNRLHYEPQYHANWGFLGNLYESMGNIDRAFKAYARQAECTLHSRSRPHKKEQVYEALLEFCVRHRRQELLGKSLQWAERAGLQQDLLRRYQRMRRHDVRADRPAQRLDGPRDMPRLGAEEMKPVYDVELLTPFIALESDITSVVIRFRNRGMPLPRFKALLTGVPDGWAPLHHEPFQIPYLPRGATTVYRFPVKKGMATGSGEFRLHVYAEPTPEKTWSEVREMKVPVRPLSTDRADLSIPSLFQRQAPGYDTELGMHDGLLNNLVQNVEQTPVVISAPGGTGKSALLREFSRLVRNTFDIIYISGDQAGDREDGDALEGIAQLETIMRTRNVHLESNLSWLKPIRRLVELIRFVNTKLTDRILVIWDDAFPEQAAAGSRTGSRTTGESADPSRHGDDPGGRERTAVRERLDMLDELGEIVHDRLVIGITPWHFSQELAGHPLMKRARKLRMPFLNEKKTEGLLGKLSRESGLILPEETVERFWRLSRGYIGFMKGLSEEVVDNILNRELRMVVAPQDVDRAANLMIERSPRFTHRWRPEYLSDEAVAIARYVMEHQRRPGQGVPVAALNQQLGLEDSVLQAVMDELTSRVRLMYIDSDRGYLCFNGVLMDWFLEQDRGTFHIEEQWRGGAACVDPGEKSALFVDHENLYLSLRDRGLVEAGAREGRWLLWVARQLRKKAEESGPLAVQPVVVANWDRPPFRYHMRSYRNAGYDVRIPATSKSGSADFELYDEIHSVLARHPEVGRFLLVSADRDFAQVALRIRDRYGKHVQVWAVAGPSLSKNYEALLGDDLQLLNEYLAPSRRMENAAFNLSED
ncbi:NYN domain-containing protein [bacterium]|nr:NYN domain-containing protein [candidate division CSSED10-310 bacterium]